MKTQTVIFSAPNVVELHEKDVLPLKPDEVLIKTRKSLISTGTELTVLQADYPPGSNWEKLFPFPRDAGYANIGEVVEVGSAVTTPRVGDMVATESPHASYVTWSAENCHPVLPEIPADEATFFVIAEICLQGVRRAGIKMGESVIIYGLGLLGQVAGMLCSLDGSFPVIGVDMSELRLRLAGHTGFDLTIHGGTDKVKDEVGKGTKGRMADVVFEVTGIPSIFEQEMQLLHEQGRFVLLSSPRGKTTMDFHDYVNAPSHTIIGAHNYSHPPVGTLQNPWTIARDVELFFDLMGAKKASVSHLITHRYAYDRAPDAYRFLVNDRENALGVILDWESE